MLCTVSVNSFQYWFIIHVIYWYWCVMRLAERFTDAVEYRVVFLWNQDDRVYDILPGTVRLLLSCSAFIWTPQLSDTYYSSLQACQISAECHYFFSIFLQSFLDKVIGTLNFLIILFVPKNQSKTYSALAKFNFFMKSLSPALFSSCYIHYLKSNFHCCFDHKPIFRYLSQICYLPTHMGFETHEDK